MLRGAAQRGDPRDGALEPAEHHVEVIDLPQVIPRHPGPDLRNDLHQPIAGQPAQRLHHRLLADAELDAQGLGRDAFTCRIAALHQALFELVIDRVVESAAAAVQRSYHGRRGISAVRAHPGRVTARRHRLGRLDRRSDHRSSWQRHATHSPSLRVARRARVPNRGTTPGRTCSGTPTLPPPHQRRLRTHHPRSNPSWHAHKCQGGNHAVLHRHDREDRRRRPGQTGRRSRRQPLRCR